MPDVQELISRLGKECSVEKSEEGWHNITHFCSCQDKEFVVREPKNQDSDLRNEHRTLQFLRDKDFAPNTITFENDLHAMEKVGDRELGVDEMTENQLRKWGTMIADIHSEEFSEYRNSYPEAELLSLEGWWEQKAGGWVEEIDGTHQKLLEEFTGVADMLSGLESGRTGLIHADITSSTRISETGELYIIDWEFARFTPRPEMWMAQPLTHGKLSAEEFTPAMQAYADRSGLAEPALQKSIEAGERMLSVFAAISLARRYGTEDSRIEKYLGEDF